MVRLRTTLNIYVISLTKATDRRAFISAQLEKLGLEFEFIDAVVGKEVYADPDLYARERALQVELRDMTPGEVGCALSHQRAYELIEERGLPYAFVLEDDAVLSPDVPMILRRLEAIIEPNDVVTLERCDVYSRRGAVELPGGFRLVRPRMVKYGSMSQAAGYLIGREAAARIRSRNRPVFVPSDSWGQYEKEIRLLGVIPTLTLVRQNIDFECSTQDRRRSEFTRRKPADMLWYAFKIRTPLGRTLVRMAKRALGRT